MMKRGAILAVCLFSTVSSKVDAAWISPQSLLQYQYNVDVEQCNLTLSNGIRVEFGGVFANESNNIVFHELVIIGVPTTIDFPFNSLAKIALYDQNYSAKVVRKDDGKVYFAVDSQFLGALWSSNSDAAFRVGGNGYGDDQGQLDFSLPSEVEQARIALSKGKSCYEDALMAD